MLMILFLCFVLRFSFGWEDISNTHDSIWPHCQTHRSSSKISRYATLPSRHLEMWWNTVFRVWYFSYQTEKDSDRSVRSNVTRSRFQSFHLLKMNIDIGVAGSCELYNDKPCSKTTLTSLVKFHPQACKCFYKMLLFTRLKSARK